MNLIRLLLLVLLTVNVSYAGRLMDTDFASEAELISRGATKAQLLNTTKIYDTNKNNTLNNILNQLTINPGTTSQYFRGDKTWQTLNKAAVGLGNVDNTSDADKPISTATQTALNAKAPIASPTLTGDPKAPTASFGDNDTSIATTAYVRANAYPQQNDLASGVDLDTVTSTGIYHQPHNASAAAGTNYPAPYAGKLEVFSKGSMTYQTYHVYQASEAKYFRGRYNTAWSAWKKVTSDDQLTEMVTSISSSSVDNTVPRFDGVTGKVIQTSSVAINDSNAISGLTGITSSGTATLSGDLNLSSNTTNTQTGSSVVITAATSNVIRLTGSGLTSIAGYAGVVSGRITYLINTTANTIIILNDSVDASTASNRIITGTGISVDLAPGATLALIWNTTTQRHQVVGGTGGGSGSSDPMQIALLDAEKDNASNWLLNGASISISEAYALSGKKSYRVSRSTVGYVVSPAIPVPMWAKGKTVSISNMVFYNGESGGMTLKVWDSTNNVEIYSGDIPAQSGVILTADKFFIPHLCDEIRVRVYNNTTSLVSELYFDNLEINGDLLKSLNIEGDKQSERLTNVGNLTTTTNLSTLTSGNNIGGGIYTKDSTGLTFLRDAFVTINYAVIRNGVATGMMAVINVDAQNRSSNNFNGNLVTASFSGDVFKNQKITFTGLGSDTAYSNVTISATARSQVTVFPDETFSTDINPVYWKATACLETEIGCYNTYSYASGGNTRTICATRPTSQTDAEMRVQGPRLYTRVFAAAGTCNNPTEFYFIIGKNFSSVDTAIYKDTARTVSGSLEYKQLSTSVTRGAWAVSYNSATGGLSVNAGYVYLNTTTDNGFTFSDISTAPSGYLVIKASKTGLGMANVPARYPVKFIESGSNWATIYNDGWVEQGLYFGESGGLTNKAMLVPMKDTSYTFTMGPYVGAGSGTVLWQDLAVQVATSTNIAVLVNSMLKKWVKVEGWGASSVVKLYGAKPNY